MKKETDVVQSIPLSLADSQSGVINVDDRMSLYLPGMPRFVKALQLFLKHTTEYETLYPWYLQLLDSLKNKRYFLDIGTGDGSSLTDETDKQFKMGIAIEKNETLISAIRARCPNTQVIGQSWENVTHKQLISLLAAHDPTFNNDINDTFDLIQLIHVLYYIPEQEWQTLFEELASMVRVGGIIFACLQDETNDYYALYHQFTPYQYNLCEHVDRFQAKFDNWQVTSIVLPGNVRTSNLDVAQQIAEFMLCYVKFSPLPRRSAITEWINANMWQPETGLYVANTPQRIVVYQRIA